ncbi:MAG TPA: flavoprotein, partial [Acetobacterium sp.]
MKNLLKNKTVALGITGSIAAYKMANVASSLTKLGCDIQVILTKNSQEFISPLVFETLTGNKTIVDTFDRNINYEVAHVVLAKKADLFMVAPASANIIGKITAGIADDMLTTTIMACRCPKFIAPAMNTAMYENPIVQDNLKKLKDYGYKIIDPATGILACKDVGAGRLP